MVCRIGKFLNLYRRSGPLASQVQSRNLNLLECHSKVLLQNYGVNVQKFLIIEDPVEAKDLETKFKVDEYVIKAQVLAGGRGLGHFDNGFKGGVHLTRDSTEVRPIVEKMVGHKLITKQTPKEGILVHKVMVAESVNIQRETYFSIVMDRFFNGPVIIASPMGGTDIETVAKETPHLIKTYPIDIYKGISLDLAQEVALFLQFEGPNRVKAANEIKRLYDLFVNVDATQVEINPLAETSDGQVVSVDAKINFDDNAKFRQKAIFQLDDKSETHPLEAKAAENNLNYIRLDGQIGCMVNGAGLAMATMDIIKLYGGEPANFLDVGGGVKESQVKQAFEILSSDPNVKSILVNVFGGIVNCATIANGIVEATKSLNLKMPLVIRLEGTNVTAARKVLNDSGLKITFAENLDEAAKKVVSTLK
ncbi:succinate--CoA ligase [GDP-forming] subunit beta, mitochondrial [Cimex lectularius]|uniref:Succinate--CoA ligase [GDP-forming] subunit beta, mitochondrial n=1 Tax=Cimex lectularius TaxID=79782 RepID=A0A8I6S6B0_CIMLE|nr:succinate--CoA ligase [GDP-forming] subunit beta, mitochondrial [Cimex lectularius]